ncbi:MAG TPA: monovalent cation/H+ antiporter complex subunit F [Stellaceae bacterium]|nr:monovalent cation/H+ antiporter complex subunit F [Stellaceae bacterium]
MVALTAMVPALGLPIAAAWRGRVADRLVAVQVATTLTVFMLAVMTFAFDQSSFIDLALCLALLALPGGVVMALFVERWL